MYKSRAHKKSKMLLEPYDQDFKDGTTFYYLRKKYFYLQEMEIQKHNNFNSFFSQTKYKYPTKPFFFFFEIFGISLAIIKNKKPLKKKNASTIQQMIDSQSIKHCWSIELLQERKQSSLSA